MQWGVGVACGRSPPAMKPQTTGRAGEGWGWRCTPPEGCIRREGTSEAAPEGVRQAVEEVAEAVGGGYCRLQMPLRLALAVSARFE